MYYNVLLCCFILFCLFVKASYRFHGRTWTCFLHYNSNAWVNSRCFSCIRVHQWNWNEIFNGRFLILWFEMWCDLIWESICDWGTFKRETHHSTDKPVVFKKYKMFSQATVLETPKNLWLKWVRTVFSVFSLQRKKEHWPKMKFSTTDFLYYLESTSSICSPWITESV